MVKAKVEKLRKTMPLTKIETQDIGIPLYKMNKTSNSGLDHTSDNLKSPFVEVEIAGRDSIYIRKQTAVWLFQDTERLSADRLFRVRAKQPYSETKESSKVVCDINQPQPVMAEYVAVGELCAFKLNSNFRIGRVLQFIKFDKNHKELPY